MNSHTDIKLYGLSRSRKFSSGKIITPVPPYQIEFGPYTSAAKKLLPISDFPSIQCDSFTKLDFSMLNPVFSEKAFSLLQPILPMEAEIHELYYEKRKFLMLIPPVIREGNWMPLEEFVNSYDGKAHVFRIGHKNDFPKYSQTFKDYVLKHKISGVIFHQAWPKEQE